MNVPTLDQAWARRMSVSLDRVSRAYRVKEAWAQRKFQYRNGFRVNYRNCCLKPSAWTREGIYCPWWAFPKCRAQSPEAYARLVKAINRRRVA